MKFIFVSLLVVGLAGIFSVNAHPRPHNRALRDDLEDFFVLVPKEKVLDIFFEYLAHDEQVQHVLMYIQTDEFRKLVEDVESIPDVITFYNYLKESGLDVYYVVNKLHDFIGLPPLVPPNRSTIRITGGVAGLIADIKAVLPIDDIETLYNEKLETSAEFKKLVERLQSPKFQAVIDKLYINSEFQEILKKAKAAGIDVNAIADLLSTVLGLEFPDNNSIRHSRGLHDDLEDFLALVPKKEISEIFFEYLANDEQVQNVVEYVQTSEFRELVKAVEAIPDVVNFYNYLQESGLDVYYLVNKLHEFIGLPPIIPMKTSIRITGGVAGLISDIKAALPIDDIKALYHKKLETSSEFKKLVERLQSPKFQAVVDKLMTNSEFQEILKKAKGAGVDVKAIADLLSTVLGLEFPDNNSIRHSRSLHDDLEDFLALVPKNEISEIFFEYLANDEQVQNVVEYVQTSEFRELVKAVEAIPDVVNFYNYLQESGLDVYYLVNKLHEFIGLPPIIPMKTSIRITGGVAGLISDIKAALPIDDIKALYHKKLETSSEFKKLVERLQSPKFQAVVDKLLTNSEFQEILKKAKGAGVDVKAIADLLSTVLGLEFPDNNSIRHSRGLHDDLEDFLALVPKNEISEIFFEYLANDEQVQNVVEYVQTSEFRELVKAVEAIPDVVNFYNYLQESGLDVYYLVNKLHEFIGLPPIIPMKTSIRITGGVAGLISDIKAALPIDDIKALYHKKLETSSEFKKLVERLQSPKFQAVVDKLLTNSEFQEILKKAKGAGVDVKAIADLLSTVLGLEFPDNNSIRHSRGLHDDLEDFLALVPKNEISEIFFEYLANDEQVQNVVEYVQTSEFRELVKAVEAIPDVVNFYNYLQESGLDVYYLVNKLHEFIGLPPITPMKTSIRITGGVAGLISDIKAALPIDDIKALYHKKLETSSEFKKLVERLQSPKFQAVVDKLMTNSEFQEILKKAKGAGVDVKAIADLLSTIFGLEFPSSNPQTSSRGFNVKFIIDLVEHVLNFHDERPGVLSFKDDINDFILLMPIDEIAQIAIKYILHDAEVQVAVRYVRSQELRDLMLNLQQDPEIYEFLKYFEDSGANLIDLINILNEFLAIPPYPVPRKIMEDHNDLGGVQAMLNEIRTIIPYEKIGAMYNDKIKNSLEFHHVIERIESPEFQKIVDKIVVNKGILELGYQAQLHGINIETMAKFLTEIFGLQLPDPPYFPSNFHSFNVKKNLADDFADFYYLLPMDDIVQLAIQYFTEDKEIQETFKYIQAEQFKNIIRALHKIPEYQQIIEELEAAGVDIKFIIHQLHEFIGFHEILKNHRAGMRFQKNIGNPGLDGFLESIKELLPYKEIKAMYEEKLKTSEAFAKFIELIRSQTFQGLTDKLFTNKDFQHLLHEAQAHGVNLKSISDFFLRVFGITTPPVPIFNTVQCVS